VQDTDELGKRMIIKRDNDIKKSVVQLS